MELARDPLGSFRDGVWRAQLVRRFPRRFPYGLAEGLLIALLAIQCARIVWAAFAPLGPVGSWTGAPAAVLGSDAGVLRTFDPFFRLSGQQPGTTIVTSLPVKLFGVRVDQATGRGSAIIATPDGVQSSYAVGDEIMPGIKLKAVARDGVTIDRGGASEQLYLDQSVPATVAQAASPTTAAPAVAAPGVALTADALKTGVNFAPRLEKGQVTGFVVTARGSGEVFRAAGFQPGDVVTRINGAGFRSVQDAADAVANMPASGSVSFSVERAGGVVALNARLGAAGAVN